MLGSERHVTLVTSMLCLSYHMVLSTLLHPKRVYLTNPHSLGDHPPPPPQLHLKENAKAPVPLRLTYLLSSASHLHGHACA